ncbi:MAG: carbonic anhydrase [Dehalococcoidia bacterium]
MTVFVRLLKANEQYARGFKHSGLPVPPALRLTIVTCMDARLDPVSFLGLSLGDAHVIRNAGGRATNDVIRSIVISQRLLGTSEVVVIHHTGCGLATVTNTDITRKVKDDLGVDATELDWLPFNDLEQSVLDDVEALRESDLIPADVPISGAIYEVETGSVRVVIVR